MSSLMWWNSWSSLHTYLVYGHISKSSVKVVHVKLPHKMVRDEKKLISKSRVDLSRLPRTSLLWSHTSNMWTTGLLRACTKSNRGGWRLAWESENHWDHVVLSWQPRWLIYWMLVIGNEMTRLIMKNTMTIMSFDESDEWWVNGWTEPFRIILSVLTVLLLVQHALAYIRIYILHITY